MIIGAKPQAFDTAAFASFMYKWSIFGGTIYQLPGLESWALMDFNRTHMSQLSRSDWDTIILPRVTAGECQVAGADWYFEVPDSVVDNLVPVAFPQDKVTRMTSPEVIVPPVLDEETGEILEEEYVIPAVYEEDSRRSFEEYCPIMRGSNGTSLVLIRPLTWDTEGNGPGNLQPGLVKRVRSIGRSFGIDWQYTKAMLDWAEGQGYMTLCQQEKDAWMQVNAVV